MNSKPLFSIVVPVYYNAESLNPLMESFNNLSHKIQNYDFEFVFVDDGSKDKSLEILMNLKKEDNRIKIVKLTRNFGAPTALLAGLEHAKGDIIGNISADLQDPPEIFGKMITLIENGKKVVIGIREKREDYSIFSALFYKLMRAFAIKNFPNDGFDISLSKKEVVKKICQIKEKNSPPLSLIIWAGYDYDIIFYTRKKRIYGKSKFNLGKKIKFFIDSFVSFSYVPIRFISATGIIVSFLSFLYGILVILNAICGYISVPGWASIVSVLTFLMGLIMLMLGIIGEYLWRILDEVRKREPYIIDNIYE